LRDWRSEHSNLRYIPSISEYEEYVRIQTNVSHNWSFLIKILENEDN
jgi:hypothetical protein